MKKFTVTLERITTETFDIEVEAENEDQAEATALRTAENADWDLEDSSTDIRDCVPD